MRDYPAVGHDGRGPVRIAYRVWLVIDHDLPGRNTAEGVAEALRVGLAALRARDPRDAVDAACSPGHYDQVQAVLDDIEHQIEMNRAVYRGDWPPKPPRRKGQRVRTRTAHETAEVHNEAML